MNNTIICLYFVSSVWLYSFIMLLIYIFFHIVLSYFIYFVVLLPFGDHLLKFFPDPFDFDKIGSVAANIIAERTKANGSSKGHVSFL